MDENLTAELRRGIAMTNCLDNYFSWICHIIDACDDSLYSTEDYHYALRVMFDLAFEPKITLDENRIDDVRVYLRNKFADIYGERIYDPKYLREGMFEVSDDLELHRVGMLEVLVATSIRMSEMMGETFAGRALPKWQSMVWEALENVGITTVFADECFDDADYEGVNLTNSLLSVLCKINRRGYSPDGDGSFFPLSRCEEDQRNIDIWRKMNLYLGECYDFGKLAED